MLPHVLPADYESRVFSSLSAPSGQEATAKEGGESFLEYAQSE